MDPPIPETWPGLVKFPVSRHAAPGPEFFRPETKAKFRPISPARDQRPDIERRTGRANAACSRKVSVIRDLGDCLVADAVVFEPVSTAEFPANREKNREFFNFGPDRGSKVVIRPMISVDLEQNSLLNGTGNFCEGTGNLNARTGNLNRV